MSIDLVALAAPFDPARISWRVGSTTGDKKRGLALAYLDARDVMDRLDAVCGAANWQDRYEFHGSRTVCYLSVRLDSEWVTKADGAGDSDVEAEKGAISDALKRAAVKWGIGRYLYDLASPWVEIEPAGRSFRIKDSERGKLLRVLPSPTGEPAPMGDDHVPATETNAVIADTMLTVLEEIRSLDALRSWTDKQREQIEALDEVNRKRVKRAIRQIHESLTAEAPNVLEAG